MSFPFVSPSLGMHALGHAPRLNEPRLFIKHTEATLRHDIMTLVDELTDEDRDMEVDVIMNALAISPCTALLVIRSFGFRLN